MHVVEKLYYLALINNGIVIIPRYMKKVVRIENVVIVAHGHRNIIGRSDIKLFFNPI